MVKENLIPLDKVYDMPEAGIKNYQTYFRYWKAKLVPKVISGQHPKGKGKTSYITNETLKLLKLIKKHREKGLNLTAASAAAHQELGNSSAISLSQLAIQHIHIDILKHSEEFFQDDKETKLRFMNLLEKMGIVKHSLKLIKDGVSPVFYFNDKKFMVLPSFFIHYILEDALDEPEASVFFPLYPIIKKTYDKFELEQLPKPNIRSAEKIRIEKDIEILEVDIQRLDTYYAQPVQNSETVIARKLTISSLKEIFKDYKE